MTSCCVPRQTGVIDCSVRTTAERRQLLSSFTWTRVKTSRKSPVPREVGRDGKRDRDDETLDIRVPPLQILGQTTEISTATSSAPPVASTSEPSTAASGTKAAPVDPADWPSPLTDKRHGVAVLLVLLLCVSLFLVYNGSFNGASRDSNDTHIRQHEQLRRPTDASSVRVAKPHPPVLQGYSGIIDHKPLRMHCQTCSLVTSSGHLTGGGRGEEIDRAECVIRMNDAPTARGYARDVGRRTSLRVIAHSSMQRVLRSRHELLNASQDTVFIFWGPSNYMRRDGKGLVYNNLRLMNQVLPKLKVYIISLQKMLQFDDLFKNETGKDRRISNSWLSTGWFTMTIALELCDRINVYGMVAPDFCR
ncbi:hypothetical protein Q5P01_022782 [Channa striata]|uniref:Alpha-N-acetylgalactosaminide alpha-2,6-sialyltransferase 5 n=1 Tax=Channa striata TaxID=64152 RepID=A0AA88LRN2_CHASR|nr:hypothetical protein Q5P01_022782 [Channa striata]